MRDVFSQTDQCLDIDDPLTAVLDRVHSASHTPNDVDRYVVSRLSGGGTEEDAEEELRSALQRSFIAFRKRRESDQVWIETRTQSALALLGDVDDDQVGPNVRDLSASLGLPEDALAQLHVDVLDSAPAHPATIATWTDWMFDWMTSHAQHAMRLLRPEDLSDLFGTAFDQLDSDGARVSYAMPKLQHALARWMQGEPLTTIQSSLPGTRSAAKKSTSARKFVLRVLPTVAHLFAAPSLIIDRELNDGWTDLEDTAPGAFRLGQCVRRGYSSLEMCAVYEHTRSRTPFRRDVHRAFANCQRHLSPAPDHETWAETTRRVATALVSVNRR